LRWIPYADAAETPNVVVDGAPAAATRLTLSHWPGSPTPPELRADLSADIAFSALVRPEYLDGINAVTNNHFDQDGLASVFALVDPDAAAARCQQIIDVARAGDFGTFFFRDAARIAFVLAAFDDPAQSPLPASLFDEPYDVECATLYAELLPRSRRSSTIPIGSGCCGRPRTRTSARASTRSSAASYASTSAPRSISRS
jgi:hypothetical protein